MGIIKDNTEYSKPIKDGTEYNAVRYYNGEFQELFKLEISYKKYLTNMLFALDYHDVNYNFNNVLSSIVDSSGYNNQGFSYYNVGRVSKASDGSMLWNPLTDSYSTIGINGLKDTNFNNGMTTITMCKPLLNGYTHMIIGTPGHNNDSSFQYIGTSSGCGLNRHPSSADNVGVSTPFSVIGNKYIVTITIIDPSNSTGYVYTYLKSGNNIVRTYYNQGTIRGSLNTGLQYTIGANHANDVDIDNSGRSTFGINSQVKYIFSWNEVFNQTKIENFINDVLINEF